LDEADRFVLNNQELIGILNAGHARFDAHVIINQKQNDGNWEPAEFSIWCAKAVAGNEVKDDTITNRSLVIRLRRKLISESITRYTYDYPQKQQSIREQIEAWAANIQLSNFTPLELSGSTDRVV
jgi:putative DNA primase/helicase